MRAGGQNTQLMAAANLIEGLAEADELFAGLGARPTWGGRHLDLGLQQLTADVIAKLIPSGIIE